MLVLGVDSSTTATKAIAWDAAGEAVAEGRAGLSLQEPEPDGWEQDAEDWWRSTVAAITECVAKLGGRAGEISALAVAHQRETFVLTDAAGTPLAPALVWMDARARAQVKRAVDRLGAERLHELSGKPACLTPSLYKVMYLLERHPEIAAQDPVLCDVHAFLVWRLTGRCATSLASADPLGLVDMAARAWSSELAALAGLSLERMPELVPPGAPIGTVTPAAAAATGLREGLPVIAGAGDGQAAGLGAGIVAPGRAYLNLGTAVVSGVLSRDYQIDLAFRTLYGAAPGTHFLETDLKGGTFTLTWLVEKLLGRSDPERALAELEREASALRAGADGLMLVPYWNGVMNPYWDDDASGIAVGFNGGHGPAHLYRAIVEGIAFEQRVHTSGVERATGTPIEEMVVMGGGSRSALWCQILADVLGKRIVRAHSSEATALGAGILAAVASGMHPDLATAVGAMSRTGAVFEPGELRETYDRLYREVYAELFPALRAALGRLTALRA
jgi:sugar (pentulose or hexulose) kinase